jgi:hypothetical protein
LTIFFFYVSFPAGQAHHGTNSSTTYHIRSTYTTLLSATRARTVVHTVVSFNLFLIDQYLRGQAGASHVTTNRSVSLLYRLGHREQAVET